MAVSMVGGDWLPVVVVAMGLHRRGHEVPVVGDAGLVLHVADPDPDLIPVDLPTHLSTPTSTDRCGSTSAGG